MRSFSILSAAGLVLPMVPPLAAQTVASGDRTLSFPAGSAGRGIAISAADGGQTAAQSTQPVSFYVCGPCTDETYTQMPLAIGYGTVLAQAAVASPAGSLFKVSDVYAAGAADLHLSPWSQNGVHFMSVSRGRPPGVTSGIEGPSTTHSASVRPFGKRPPGRLYVSRCPSVYMAVPPVSAGSRDLRPGRECGPVASGSRRV